MLDQLFSKVTDIGASILPTVPHLVLDGTSYVTIAEGMYEASSKASSKISDSLLATYKKLGISYPDLLINNGILSLVCLATGKRTNIRIEDITEIAVNLPELSCIVFHGNRRFFSSAKTRMVGKNKAIDKEEFEEWITFLAFIEFMWVKKKTEHCE